jgi:hypothetical protein
MQKLTGQALVDYVNACIEIDRREGRDHRVMPIK